MKITIIILLVIGAIIGVLITIRKNEEEAFQIWYKHKFLVYCELNKISIDDLDIKLLRAIYMYEHDPKEVLILYDADYYEGLD